MDTTLDNQPSNVNMDSKETLVALPSEKCLEHVDQARTQTIITSLRDDEPHPFMPKFLACPCILTAEPCKSDHHNPPNKHHHSYLGAKVQYWSHSYEIRTVTQSKDDESNYDEKKETTQSGWFSADFDAVWGVDFHICRTESLGNGKMEFDFKTGFGDITADVRSGGCRIPFLFNAITTSGDVTVYLPRSFAGYLSLSTEMGSITLSEGLRSSSTTLAKVDSTSWYFIGSSKWDSDYTEKWVGDMITAVSELGDIKLAYADERQQPERTHLLEFTIFGTHFRI